MKMENNSKTMGDQIEDRLLDFAVRVIRLSKALPQDDVGSHIAKQVMRSGTSPAPNYAEARGAESRADFKHKLGIVVKELNETKIWLRMIEKADLIQADRLNGITREASALAKIIQASLTTLRSNVITRPRGQIRSCRLIRLILGQIVFPPLEILQYSSRRKPQFGLK